MDLQEQEKMSRATGTHVCLFRVIVLIYVPFIWNNYNFFQTRMGDYLKDVASSHIQKITDTTAESGLKVALYPQETS